MNPAPATTSSADSGLWRIITLTLMTLLNVIFWSAIYYGTVTDNSKSSGGGTDDSWWGYVVVLAILVVPVLIFPAVTTWITPRWYFLTGILQSLVPSTCAVLIKPTIHGHKSDAESTMVGFFVVGLISVLFAVTPVGIFRKIRDRVERRRVADSLVGTAPYQPISTGDVWPPPPTQ